VTFIERVKPVRAGRGTDRREFAREAKTNRATFDGRKRNALSSRVGLKRFLGSIAGPKASSYL
jgi:hypothetical protein